MSEQQTAPSTVAAGSKASSTPPDKPCMIIGTMVHAKAWPKDKYPAPGL
jgi:hypothetical protein